MAKLFSYDNPVWRFMGRVADVFFLTVLWAACSLPVITAGASTSALYYVSLKMVKNREGYLGKSFFKAFRDNFAQSTVIWLLMLAAGAFLGTDLYFFYHLESTAAVFVFWLLFVFAVLYLLVAVLVFPLEARLDTKIGKLFFMAFMVSIKNFSWVMLMLVIVVCILAAGVFVFWPVLLVAAGTIAYLHSLILVWIVFPKYGWNGKEE
ncbi:MAG TPA: hypothetical protein DCZ40_09690 [Lachnospiraceae bacterium]|nr:hypothetical protein [Lachnospiraceae bacterium]